MNLFRVMQYAVLATAAVAADSLFAQSATVTSTSIRPYVTISAGPSGLMSEKFKNGGQHPAFDVTAGVRKQLTRKFGAVISANAGKTTETVLGGEDAVCRIRYDGKPGCYPNTPIVSWFGASAGAEAYLGRTLLGVQFGPAVFSVPVYERALVAGSPEREFGLRSQLDYHIPVFRFAGITLSAVDRYVPGILDDRWHLTSMSVGLTLR